MQHENEHQTPQDRIFDSTVEMPYGTIVTHSERLFRAMALIAIVGHAGILVAAALVQVIPLVWFNIVSVLIYLVAYRCACRGSFKGAFIVGVLEVVAHAWFATAVLGFASGFHIYALSLIPLAMTFEPWSIRTRIGLTALLILNYLALAVAGSVVFPDATSLIVDLFRYGNFVVGGLVLAAISYYYVNAVSLAEGALVRQNRRLNALSRTDQLTGLPNRRHALEWIAHEQARAARHGGTTCVCIADLDYFKHINDEHGHDAGDSVLSRLAGVISTTVRKQDVTARWGGEEFLMLLPDTDLAGALGAMEKVRTAVASTILDWTSATITVTITIGVAEMSAETSVDEAIRHADQALYRGKRHGRNRVETARDGSACPP